MTRSTLSLHQNHRDQPLSATENVSLIWSIVHVHLAHSSTTSQARRWYSPSRLVSQEISLSMSISRRIRRERSAFQALLHTHPSYHSLKNLQQNIHWDLAHPTHQCSTTQQRTTRDQVLTTLKLLLRIMEDSMCLRDTNPLAMQWYQDKGRDLKTMMIEDQLQFLDQDSITTFLRKLGGTTVSLLLEHLKGLSSVTLKPRVSIYINHQRFRDAWTRLISCTERLRVLRPRRLCYCSPNKKKCI